MKFTAQQTGRLNKIIANSGIYSRRETDKIILDNKVLINNKLAVLGQPVNTGDNRD
jgi:16S rRNA U516 pseudouridylate synthase RsuA-like enzyme